MRFTVPRLFIRCTVPRLFIRCTVPRLGGRRGAETLPQLVELLAPAPEPHAYRWREPRSGGGRGLIRPDLPPADACACVFVCVCVCVCVGVCMCVCVCSLYKGFSAAQVVLVKINSTVKHAVCCCRRLLHPGIMNLNLT